MSNFKEASTFIINQMIQDITTQITHGYKPYRPKHFIDYIEYICIQNHIRSEHDIHGKIEFKTGDLVHLKASEENQHGCIIELNKFSKIGIKKLLK